MATIRRARRYLLSTALKTNHPEKKFHDSSSKTECSSWFSSTVGGGGVYHELKTSGSTVSKGLYQVFVRPGCGSFITGMRILVQQFLRKIQTCAPTRRIYRICSCDFFLFSKLNRSLKIKKNRTKSLKIAGQLEVYPNDRTWKVFWCPQKNDAVSVLYLAVSSLKNNLNWDG